MEPPELKLAIFPGQTHSARASLFLTGDLDCENCRLEMDATASNTRLADAAWKRPIGLDLARFGLRARP